MSGEMTVRTTSKAKALMKALNVSVSVLPLLPGQEDNSRRGLLRLVLFQKVGHGSKQLVINSFRKFWDQGKRKIQGMVYTGVVLH